MLLYIWLLTLISLVKTGHAFTFLGAPAQVPLSAAPQEPSVAWVGQQPSGTRSKSAITPEISAYVEGLLQDRHVPGLSVGVVRVDGDSIVTEFGAWGNMTEDGHAMKPETLFSIGSCSKAFLASAVGILMDDFAQGRNVTALPPTVSEFTWDTKIQDLLPGFWAVDDEWATKKANVRDILNHVSGLTRHDSSWLNEDTPLFMIRRMRYMKHKYELREKWSYNNLMYITASHIVSMYSGKPYTAFVKERILEPLNMTTTTFRWDEAEASEVFSHAWSGSEKRRIPYWFAGDKFSDFIAGAGGIISSTPDMTKWLAMLLHGGVNPYTNKTVVPRSAFDEMTTAHSIVYGKPTTLTSIAGYGMGWIRTSFRGHDLVGHNGGLPGFLSDVTFLPEQGLGIATFVNSDGTHNAQSEIPRRIIEDYLNMDRTIAVPHWNPRQDDSLLAFSVPHSSSHTPRCNTTASSVVPIEQYAGIYYNPGYQNFTLCAVTTAHDTCRHILSEWAAVSPNGELEPGILYGKSMHRLYSHLTLQRVCSGDGYDSLTLTPVTLFPSGYGRNDTSFVYRGLAPPGGVEVECDIWYPGVVVGCGLMNSEEGPRGTGESIRDRADVWFLKIWEMWADH